MKEIDELINQLDRWTEKQNNAYKELKGALAKFLSQTTYSEELKKKIEHQKGIFSEAFNKRMGIINEIIKKHKEARHQEHLERLRSRKAQNN